MKLIRLLTICINSHYTNSPLKSSGSISIVWTTAGIDTVSRRMTTAEDREVLRRTEHAPPTTRMTDGYGCRFPRPLSDWLTHTQRSISKQRTITSPHNTNQPNLGYGYGHIAQELLPTWVNLEERQADYSVSTQMALLSVRCSRRVKKSKQEYNTKKRTILLTIKPTPQGNYSRRTPSRWQLTMSI